MTDRVGLHHPLDGVTHAPQRTIELIDSAYPCYDAASFGNRRPLPGYGRNFFSRAFDVLVAHIAVRQYGRMSAYAALAEPTPGGFSICCAMASVPPESS